MYLIDCSTHQVLTYGSLVYLEVVLFLMSIHDDHRRKVFKFSIQLTWHHLVVLLIFIRSFTLTSLNSHFELNCIRKFITKYLISL